MSTLRSERFDGEGHVVKRSRTSAGWSRTMGGRSNEPNSICRQLFYYVFHLRFDSRNILASDRRSSSHTVRIVLYKHSARKKKSHSGSLRNNIATTNMIIWCGLNQNRRRLVGNIHIYICVCVHVTSNVRNRALFIMFDFRG